VAEPVVEALEPVHVHEDDPEGEALPGAAVHLALERLLQVPAVEQARERVADDSSRSCVSARLRPVMSMRDVIT
jgi:hypothetical protein